VDLVSTFGRDFAADLRQEQQSEIRRASSGRNLASRRAMTANWMIMSQVAQ
jgi:hypothetical protein